MATRIAKHRLDWQGLATLRAFKLQFFSAFKAKLGSFPDNRLAFWAFHF
jgi:hypothetical protein